MRQIERLQRDASKKAAPIEKTRGPELVSLYQRAAPAVALIVVGGGRGFGSGFLVSEDGWLVTNHHVAKEALLSDDLSREVTVNFGRLTAEGHMEPITARYPAIVYKWDEVRDLALLKLQNLPSQAGKDNAEHFLKVADKGPVAGDDVAAIGNAGITLLWSLKPGQVQAVGQDVIDSAEIFRRWDEKTRASAQQTLAGSYEAVKEEVESQLRRLRDVLLVQATCPTLPGDSGGPLLNMNGEVVGVTDFFKAEEHGGHANYFIHAREVADFLKDKPASPIVDLPSPWDQEVQACKIRDADLDGQPETMALFQVTVTPSGRTENLVAIAWDLAEASHLEKYLSQPSTNLKEQSQTAPINAEAVYNDKAMQFQAYVVQMPSSVLFAYDLDNDGYFELVRIRKEGNDSSVAELISEGRGKPYVSKQLHGVEPWLEVSRLPEPWRARYKQAVINVLQQPVKQQEQLRNTPQP